MSDSIQQVSVDKIAPNPHQPRQFFPSKAQKELKDSIEHNGLIQPIVLRKLSDDQYQILAGERRYRAVNDLGHPTISAIVREINDSEMKMLSLLENLQREDLSAIEVARTYKKLLSEESFTQEQLAAKLGIDRSTISNAIRLLELPEEIQNDILETRLQAGHGRALLALKGDHKILTVRDKIIKQKLSVRQAEKEVRKALRRGTGEPSSPKPSGPIPKDSAILQLEDSLSNRLGTRVEIWGSEEGSIQISFSDPTDFNRIYNRIMEEELEDE